MFHIFQEEGIDLTMIYLEAYYIQLEVDDLLDKIVIEKIKDEKVAKLKKEILDELKKSIVVPKVSDWEIVYISYFVSNSLDKYRIKDYDSNNYIYIINISYK